MEQKTRDLNFESSRNPPQAKNHGCSATATGAVTPRRYVTDATGNHACHRTHSKQNAVWTCIGRAEPFVDISHGRPE